MAQIRAIPLLTSHQARPTRPLAPVQRFCLQQRVNVANRLLGVNGARPETRLTEILSHPSLTSSQMAETIRDVLTFSRENHEATYKIISEVVLQVEAMTRAEVLNQAQAVIDRYYHDKIEHFNNEELKQEHPAAPPIKEFAAMEPNGHFDPYQLIASGTWGTVSMTIDFGRELGYDEALVDFDLRGKLHDAMVMARALEIL